MSRSTDWADKLDKWDKEDAQWYDNLRHGRNPYTEPTPPPGPPPFTGTVEPSEEELVGSGRAKFVPMDYSWEDAIAIAAGEKEGPRRVNLLQRARAAITGEKLPEQDIITPSYRVKELLAPILAIPKKVQHLIESGDTVIDEAGNVVTRESFKRGQPRPPATQEEQSGVAAELAGMGTVFSQFSRFGVPGTKLATRVKDFLRATKKEEPTPKDVDKFIKELSDYYKKHEAGEYEKIITEFKRDKVITPAINRWAAQRQAEQEAEVTRLAALKAQAATEPLPPGPRSQYPRVEDMPPGESSPWPRRQITAGEPTQIIEAPARSPGSLEDAVTNAMIREEQASEGGPVNWPTARVVDVPQEPTPAPVPGTTILRDRLRDSPEVRVGSRNQSWVQQGESLSLVDDLENVNARITRIEIGEGAEKRIVFQLTDGDGKRVKWFSDAKDAVAEGNRRNPGKFQRLPVPYGPQEIQGPPEPPGPPTPPPPTTPPPAPPPPTLAVPTPPPPPTPVAPSAAVSAADAAAEAQTNDLRQTFTRGPQPPRPTDIAVDPTQPYQMMDGAFKSAWKRGYDAITNKWRPFSMKAKAAINLSSPSNILKDYPIVQKLIHITDETRHAINNKADTLAAAYRDLTKAVGSPKETSRLLRERDARKPMTGASPEIQQKVDDFYRMAEDATGQLAGESIFEGGFQKRLMQSHVIQDGKLVAKEHMTEDVNRILPPQSGKKMQAMLSKVLTGDEAYTPENVVRTLRAIARQSEMGTKLNPGYMAKIKPLLAEIENMPQVVRAEASDIVNHFIGAPQTRSPQWLQRWADRSRAYQFVSKMGYNITSPIWNAGQNFLTLTETSVKSMTKATARMWEDMYNRRTGRARDPEYVKLLKDAGIEHELSAPGVLSDIGVLPTDVMSKWDTLMSKAVEHSGKGFRWVEKNNRVRAFLSGYEDAVADNLTRDAAIEYGKKVMRKTQFTSGEADIPALFRGAKGSAVGQFKTFVIKYHEFVTENFADLVKAAVNPHLTGAERLRNINKFTKFWTSQVAVAGTGAIPGIEFLFGDKLKELPDWLQHGIGGLLGISLAKQFGIGPLPVATYRDFLYNIPGPALGAIQDAWSLASGYNKGSGMDFTKWNHELTWDDAERKFVRLLPAGVQLARAIEALKTYQSGGERHKSLTFAEAIGLTPATGPKLSEVVSDTLLGVVKDFAGVRDLRREKEVDINEEARADMEVERRARITASELFTARKYKEAEAILKKASDKLGYPVLLDVGNIRAGQEAEFHTALERLREKRAKQGIVIPKP